jgi:hypothetical protein
MKIYSSIITSSFQLPLLAADPIVSSSGQVWFNTSGTGSVKYAVTSGSFVITRTLIN